MPRTVRALVLALVLALAGVLVVVQAVGSLAGADHVLLSWRALRDGAGSQGWSSPTTRLVCLVLAVVGLALVVLTLRGSRADVELRTDVEQVAGVASARARLLGTPEEPVLVLDLVLRRGADLAAVCRGVEEHVLVPARATVERAELPTAVHLEVESDPGASAATARVA